MCRRRHLDGRQFQSVNRLSNQPSGIRELVQRAELTRADNPRVGLAFGPAVRGLGINFLIDKLEFYERKSTIKRVGIYC